MTSRRLRVPEEVNALIRHMHPGPKRKIGATLAMLLINPDHGKALQDELLGLRSVRVGQLRIIYRTAPGIIELVAVGPRRTIYEETLRLLHRDAQKGKGS